jgi:hypothetical protein
MFGIRKARLRRCGNLVAKQGSMYQYPGILKSNLESECLKLEKPVVELLGTLIWSWE